MVIQEYVDSLVPELGEVWSLDEMMINVKNTQKMNGKGFYDWVWTIIDPKTKFVLATEVSKRREVIDAQKIIAKGKLVSKPNYVITDSLRTYEQAIKRIGFSQSCTYQDKCTQGWVSEQTNREIPQ